MPSKKTVTKKPSTKMTQREAEYHKAIDEFVADAERKERIEDRLEVEQRKHHYKRGFLVALLITIPMIIVLIHLNAKLTAYINTECIQNNGFYQR